MSVPELEKLRHREVEVWALGIIYKGILEGADETTVYLRGLTCYHTIDITRISVIRVPGEGRLQIRHRTSGLSAEFFAFQPGEEEADAAGDVHAGWDASDAADPGGKPGSGD